MSSYRRSTQDIIRLYENSHGSWHSHDSYTSPHSEEQNLPLAPNPESSTNVSKINSFPKTFKELNLLKTDMEKLISIIDAMSDEAFASTELPYKSRHEYTNILQNKLRDYSNELNAAQKERDALG